MFNVLGVEPDDGLTVSQLPPDVVAAIVANSAPEVPLEIETVCELEPESTGSENATESGVDRRAFVAVTVSVMLTVAFPF
jgi:hypothetical protein